MENEKLILSVLDIEKKYRIDPEENTYGNQKLVSWGVDNSLPKLYKNCYYNSATLKAIVDGTINYVLGDSIEVTDDAAYWREQVNRTGMTVRQLIAKLAFNYLVYGGFAIQVIYNKLGAVVELYPLDFGRCRTNENNTKIFYAKSWTKYQTKSDCYDCYNPKHIDLDNPTQIFYFKGDFTSSVYPLPPYAGAMVDVLTEIECAKYSLNTVSAGFQAKYVFNFPDVGNLTDEQKRGMEEAIKTKFCGADAPNNFMLYWKNAEGEGIDIKKIESDDTSEKYLAIRNSVRENIFIAFRCTPLLFGLPNATNGFSTNEYKDSYKLFLKSVVEPIQDIILSAFSKVTQTEGGIVITPFTIDFER